METAEKTLAEQFKDGLDQNGAVKLAERVAELEERLSNGDSGEVADLTKERDDLKEQNADLTGQLAAAIKKLDAKPKSVAVKDTAQKLRKFKDIPAEDRPDRDALQALVAASDDVEIALIDDKGREVPGSKPLAVKGDVWRQHTLGLMQSEPVELTGDGPAFSFVGYALVVDGKHVATSWRSEPVNVAPGATIKLENDIVF